MSMWRKDKNGNLVSSPNPLEWALTLAFVASGIVYYLCNYFVLTGTPRIIISVSAGVVVFAFTVKTLWPKSQETKEESTVGQMDRKDRSD